MFKVLLFLHLLTAIFAIGPLVHAVTTASRGCAVPTRKRSRRPHA
ncbi:hypothetical protein [Branchiibius cervicis]|uniref:Uncharacterized protein n=1 Tax=Branchiibius cervicis TaxID=908252 RepID=A0ABW2ANR2_9MICO